MYAYKHLVESVQRLWEEGKRIDPETAQVACFRTQPDDPYGLLKTDTGCDTVKTLMARAPESDTWVLFEDLPPTVEERLRERIKHKDTIEGQRIPSHKMIAVGIANAKHLVGNAELIYEQTASFGVALALAVLSLERSLLLIDQEKLTGSPRFQGTVTYAAATDLIFSTDPAEVCACRMVSEILAWSSRWERICIGGDVERPLASLVLRGTSVDSTAGWEWNPSGGDKI